MLHTITPDAMRLLEQTWMRQTDTPSLTLMERAAAQVANVAEPELRENLPLLAVCGAGNNGGDGLAAVRILLERHETLTAIVWRLSGEPSEESREQLRRLEPFAERVCFASPQEQAPDCCVILDAMFGTGLKRPLAGEAALAAHAVNACDAPVIAVDVPSGLDGLAGCALGTCVCATKTVSFHRLKTGLLLNDGLDVAGECIVADIGLPSADDASPTVLEAGDALLPARKRNTHKGTYGRVLLWAGSPGMAGAAAIAATAALRAGCGLATVACPAEIMPTVQMLCPCATCLPLSEDEPEAGKALLTALERADAAVIGCGLGQSARTRALLERLLSSERIQELPVVLDADALNSLAASEMTERLPENCVLTPHPAEAARLLGWSTAQVTGDPLAAAHALREKHGGTIVLKGASTVIAAEDGTAISPFGSAAMAKGGSGDALAGVLGGLLAGRAAYGFGMARLLQSGCALHGLAGELAAQEEHGLLATDLCEAIARVPRVMTRAVRQLSLSRRELAASALGRHVRVTVDRPLGSRHPEHRDLLYRLNYGYVADVLAEDNEWQDAYILGEQQPVEVFEGEVVAVIHRLDDSEDKWVVAAAGTRVSADEVRHATDFVEQFYQSQIHVLEKP